MQKGFLLHKTSLFFCFCLYVFIFIFKFCKLYKAYYYNILCCSYWFGTWFYNLKPFVGTLVFHLLFIGLIKFFISQEFNCLDFDFFKIKYWTINKVEAPEEWIVQTNKTPLVTFNIFTDVRYHHVKFVGDEVTLIFSTIRLGKIIKKSNVILLKRDTKCYDMKCVCLLPNLALTWGLVTFICDFFS